jgi:hypothetical protein
MAGPNLGAAQFTPLHVFLATNELAQRGEPISPV